MPPKKGGKDAKGKGKKDAGGEESELRCVVARDATSLVFYEVFCMIYICCNVLNAL